MRFYSSLLSFSPYLSLSYSLALSLSSPLLPPRVLSRVLSSVSRRFSRRRPSGPRRVCLETVASRASWSPPAPLPPKTSLVNRVMCVAVLCPVVVVAICRVESSLLSACVCDCDRDCRAVTTVLLRRSCRCDESRRYCLRLQDAVSNLQFYSL